MSKFFRCLDMYSQATSNDDRAKINTDLWRDFGVEKTVFVLDLAGFSRTTEEHGIVHYLSIIQRMRKTLEPLVSRNGGTVVKFVADNCLACFPETLEAIQTAIKYNQILEEMNAAAPQGFDIHASVGIDHGRFLMVENADIFGMPVNIASKLGEDAAKPGQILVSGQAMARVGKGAGIKSKLKSVNIFGLNIEAHEVLYERKTSPG